MIQTPEGEELLRIPASVFLVEAENLLKAINENDGCLLYTSQGVCGLSYG